MENTPKVLYVKSSTSVGKLAGSIINAYSDSGAEISIRSVGAGSLNQSVKAVILSNKHFVKFGKVVQILPAFIESSKEDEISLTVIELTLKFTKL